MTDLLQLLRSKVDPSKVRKASNAKGGEWHSPCPICGGTDRFSVFPEQEGGELCQKYGLRGTWSCVRGFRKGGDLISWFTEVEGLTFQAACAELKIELEGREKIRRGYRPLRMPQGSSEPAFAPKSYLAPAEKWQEAATKLAYDAYHRLWQTPPIMNYLARRGLPQAAIDKYGLGYIEGEGKYPDCIFRARSAFGLPEKFGRDGKLVHAFRIPRGITIPVWTENMLNVLRIRIRRRDIDRDKSNPKDPKYLLVPQPGQPYSAPLMLPPADIAPDLATWVVTEAEMDAMAIHFACQGAVGAISILTAKGKPDQAAHNALARCARILVALDADEDKADGSNPGAEAWLWWKKTYPQARLWPVPEGKDPGEAFARGVNLAEWIMAGSPLTRARKSSGLSESQSFDAGHGKLGKSPEKAVVGEKKEELICWPIAAGFQSFAELPLPDRVMHEELLCSQSKCPLDDPECIIPCPKTEPAWWWKYFRDCAKFKCKGHPECIVGVLRSQIFLEALRSYGK